MDKGFALPSDSASERNEDGGLLKEEAESEVTNDEIADDYEGL